jgi:hypothetical protein
LKLILIGEATHEEHDRGGVEEGSGGGYRGFEVLRQPPVAPDPGEEALDNPASRLDGEADLIGGLAHDLEGDRGGAGDALASVAGIGEEALDEGE